MENISAEKLEAIHLAYVACRDLRRQTIASRIGRHLQPDDPCTLSSGNRKDLAAAEKKLFELTKGFNLKTLSQQMHESHGKGCKEYISHFPACITRLRQTYKEQKPFMRTLALGVFGRKRVA